MSWRNFGTSANRFVARYFSRSCVASSCSVLAFYSRISRYFRPTCVPHTQHGGRNIGTVVAQSRVYLFSRAHAYLYLSATTNARKGATYSFRKSGTKRHTIGPRNGLASSFCSHSRREPRLCSTFPTFNGDFGTFARLSFRFTGFTRRRLGSTIYLFIFFFYYCISRERYFYSTYKFLLSSD